MCGLALCVRSIFSEVYLKSNISLLIFHLDDPSIVESVVLKSSTPLALLSIFAIRSANICLIFRYYCVRYIYVYNCYILLMNLFFSNCM